MNNPQKLRILILSTHQPSYSAGLGSDVMRCLKEAGHDVDFLCRYSNEVLRQNYTCIQPRSKARNIFSKIFPRRIKSFVYSLFYRKTAKKVYEEQGMLFNDAYEIHYPDESKPGLPVEKLIQAIKKDYDLTITLWWFDFINSTSIKAVSDKLHCPIMILSIDMAPITGGCFYFNSCRRFTKECGRCPAIGGNDPNDFTNKNYLVKRNNYGKCNCAFLGNSWMNEFAVQSKLFPATNIFKVGCIIDENEFKPADRSKVRHELNLPEQSIILLARSSKEIRKGARFIIHAINNLPEQISKKNSIVLVSIGDAFLKDSIHNEHVRHDYIGRIGREDLIKYYQAADYFLSPSVDDAGPSMVNQAQMCGTPVICFDNGTAVDVVINGKSGFKTDDISDDGFLKVLSNALELIQDSSINENLRNNTRDIALNTSSMARFKKDILRYYQEMI